MVKSRMNIKIMVVALLVILAGAFDVSEAMANNLRLANGDIVSQNASAKSVTIQFDISWDNSWKDFTNNDAVWVFIKYSSDGGSTWNHATMKVSGTNPSGTSPGSGTGVELIVPADKKGCFIQRTSTGSGTVATTSVQLVWDYGYDGVSDSVVANIGLKIFGIEMVYVSQGSFYAGDNMTSAISLKQGSSDKDPWYIQNENAISVTNTASNGFYYVSGDNTGEDPTGSEFIITTSYPKGYAAFYMMKYEIAQGQYADFLDTISQTQASTRYPGESGKNRHTISGEYPNYRAARPDRACNYLSWQDVAAYCDWAAIRPMTELEFEKAARGKDIFPIGGELVWGTTSIAAASTLSGAEDGTEIVTTSGANCSFNNVTLSGGDGGRGPLRAGIFAKAATTREQSGGGYYGAMELSGNVGERLVTIGNSYGRNFLGTNGDGVLTNNGNATNADWPGYVSGDGVTQSTGSGLRGGSWNDASAGTMAISDRTKAAYYGSSRDAYGGGRGVRSGS